MNRRVSFEEIGSVAATFYAGEGVVPGQVVQVSAGETVAGCTDGGRFCGVAVSTSQDGCCGVQVLGFAQVPVSGGVTPGWAKLAADGLGGVRADADGREYLVVSVDTAEGCAVVLL